MGGRICCSFCGKVLDEDNFSNEPTFVKNAAGQSQMSGNFVRTVQSDYSASRQRILDGAFDDMNMMLMSMHEENRDSIARPALQLFTMALEKNFTRGRRKELVEASCLYISCRTNKKPYLLIDFAEYLNINVYVLGAVFLQLCELLRLQEHPIVQKPVDPSLFIHRFANSLVGDDYYKEVARTALRIIAGMKRDWMQTGRKPSGLCGAALYISALSHGHKHTKSDIVRIVHICEATLTKRLIEFEKTESGSLTIEEFVIKADELERESRSIKQPYNGLKGCGTGELLCEHKNSGAQFFAHGLCRNCYEEFIQLSGGMEGGSEPPAFQRAEQERMAKEHAKDSEIANDSIIHTMACQKQKTFEKESNVQEASGNKNLKSTEAGSIGGATKNMVTDDGDFDKLHGGNGMSEPCEESETFSDIDDVEVDGYIHNEQEKHYKKIIWEEMNREYIEEQAAKEAAAAAAKEAYEANFRNYPDGAQAAQELAAAATAAVAKSRKERQQKRAEEARNATPAQTATEATRQMLTKKRLSSKINYDVLEKLFDDSVAQESPKKSRTESGSDGDDVLQTTKKELKSEDIYKDGKIESEGEYEDVGDTGEEYAGDLYYENVETYDYEDDYGFDGF